MCDGAAAADMLRKWPQYVRPETEHSPLVTKEYRDSLVRRPIGVADRRDEAQAAAAPAFSPPPPPPALMLSGAEGRADETVGSPPNYDYETSSPQGISRAASLRRGGTGSTPPVSMIASPADSAVAANGQAPGTARRPRRATAAGKAIATTMSAEKLGGVGISRSSAPRVKSVAATPPVVEGAAAAAAEDSGDAAADVTAVQRNGRASAASKSGSAADSRRRARKIVNKAESEGDSSSAVSPDDDSDDGTASADSDDPQPPGRTRRIGTAAAKTTSRHSYNTRSAAAASSSPIVAGSAAAARRKQDERIWSRAGAAPPTTRRAAAPPTPPATHREKSSNAVLFLLAVVTAVAAFIVFGGQWQTIFSGFGSVDLKPLKPLLGGLSRTIFGLDDDAPAADDDGRPKDWSKNVRVFESRVRQLESAFPAQARRSWLQLRAAIKRTLRDEPLRPAVILLIDRGQQQSNATASSGVSASATSGSHVPASACLAKKLAEAVNEAISDSVPTTPVVHNAASSYARSSRDRKTALHRSMMHQLAMAATYTILNVQSLPGEAAMTLHAFCDNENAPYKHAAIIMTAAAAAEPADGGGAKPEALAEDALRAAWAQQLGEDQVSALIARVAVNVVVVEPEARTPCDDDGQ